MTSTSYAFQQVETFLRVFRSGPGFVGWKTPFGGYQQKAFSTVADALSLIAAHRCDANIWCSMAEFSPGATRDASNALSLRALWLDVDAHGNGAYATPDEASSAIDAFVAATGLPAPNFMHMTGHGVQPLWVLPEPIDKTDWEPAAEDLQELAKRYNLGADPITADAARILRVPGTYNFRDPDKPVETVLREVKAGYTDLATFHAAIKAALAKLPAQPVKKMAKPLLLPGIPDTPENVELVKAMLTFIDPDSEYDVWRNICWAIAASGLGLAEMLAADWSAEGASWDEDAFNTVWNSYDPFREKTVGFGTLVHHARAGGYTGPVPQATEQFGPLEFGNDLTTSEVVTNTARGLVAQRASDIEPQPVEWLVEDAIPMGMLVVIGGQPGMGKSQIALKLAAAVTTGKGLPCGNETEIGSVIILANEDDAAHTIRPRLDAAGADTTKVYIVEGVAREGQQVDLFQLDRDIAALRAKAEEIGDVREIIIDPPSAYLGPKVDAYKEADVRRVLAPLAQLAHDTGALVLLVVHLNKRNEGGAQQRFGGSTAWVAAPRAAFLVAEEEVSRRRFMLPVKNNLGNDRLGFEYQVAETLLDYKTGPIKAPFIEWLGTSNRSASELLNPPKPKEPSALDEAKDFLCDKLAEGAVPAAEIKQAASAAGIATATLNRAKNDLGVKSIKVPNGWNWELGSIFDD